MRLPIKRSQSTCAVPALKGAGNTGTGLHANKSELRVLVFLVFKMYRNELIWETGPMQYTPPRIKHFT